MNTVKATGTTNKVKNIYDLTAMQEGMLFHAIYNDSQAYIEITDITVSGELNIEVLERTFNEIIRRHDILRTIFLHKKVQKPRQVVLSERMGTVGFEDLRTNPHALSVISDFVEKERSRQFDLSKDLLLRLNVFRLAENKFRIIWSFHHIIMDGWCMAILMDEFFKIYSAYCRGEEMNLPEPVPFGVYLEWLAKQDQEKAKRFWKDYLSPVDSLTGIPGVPTGNGIYIKHELDFSIPEDRSMKIEQLCRELNISLNVFIQTAWSVLLQKMNGTSESVFGTVVSGRPAEIAGVEEILGLFINTIPVYNDFADVKTFREALLSAGKAFSKSKAFDFYPLPDILNQTPFKQDLFDHILVFENFPVDEASRSMEESTGLIVEDMQSFEQTSYDFNVYVFPGKRIHFKFDFNSEKYSLQSIGALKERFENLMSRCAEAPDTSLNALSVLLKNERELLLSVHTGTQGEFDAEATLVNLFRKKAVADAELPVLFAGDRSFTYEELDQRSDVLAQELSALGVGNEDIVGICMERSAAYIISMLGIMKAGAAYVPVDLNYPPDRQQYIIDDSKSKIVITDKDELLDSKILNYTKIDFTKEAQHIDKSRAEGLAYIIYTSGSTGNPKGVAIEHRNAASFIEWAKEEFGADDYKVVFAGTSFSFDLSIFEIFYHLSVGKKIRLLSSGIEIKDYLGKEKKILLNTVPSVINYLQNAEADFSNVVAINMAGEPIPQQVKQRIDFRNICVRNLYGPSEDTTYSTIYTLKEAENKQIIGKPLSGTKAYILDKNNELVPYGVAGELYLSGTGIARGYLLKEELTKERFLEDPFSKGNRMYKTGDLVRWTSDWNLEYLGRTDNQVKIRGHRIELGEIETALSKSETVKEAIVIAKTINGEPQLCAYLTATDDFDEQALRRSLALVLPAYMVPFYFIRLVDFPLTPNGKIDKRALPMPTTGTADDVKTAPSTEAEIKLAQIWREILGLEHVYGEDNFFDLGGHSLKATVLASLVQKHFNVEFPISRVFELNTLSKQAAAISESATSPYASIKPVPGKEYYPISAAQKRMFLLNEIEGNSTTYNLSGAVKVNGELNVQKVNDTVQRLIMRHESLRTSFRIVKKEVVQKIEEDAEPPVFFDEIEPEQVDQAIAGFFKPFELDKAPLFRIGLFKIKGKKESVLIFEIHHIISDGVSIGITINEFMSLYQGIKLPDLELQYKDYAYWQKDFSGSIRYNDQKNFWKKEFAGEIPKLELPYDKARPMVQSFEGDASSIELPANLGAKINIFCTENKITPFAFFLGAINILLSKLSAQQDIVVATPIAGRPHADLQNIIGMFVNTLALRTNVDPYLTVKDFYRAMSKKTLQAFENQDYPFDELVDDLIVDRDLSRNPLFDVMLAFQESGKESPEVTGLSFEAIGFENKNSKFDLTFFVQAHPEGYSILTQYATALFGKTTINKFEQYMLRLLNNLLTEEDSRIGTLSILSETEKTEVIAGLNNASEKESRHESILSLIAGHEGNALFSEGKYTAYRDVYEQSDRLASYFISDFNIQKGDKIAILADRSEKMIIGILAALKAGAAYVPVDPAFPEDRVAFIIKDSDSKLLMTDRAEFESEIPVFNFNTDWKNIKTAAAKTEVKIKKEDPAYIIYTSGSTGKPKGCELSHGNLLHYIEWANAYYFEGIEGNFPLYTSISFDLTITSIFCSLTRGKYLKIYSGEIAVDQILSDIFNSGDVDIVKITPAHISLLKTLQINSSKIASAIVGGEQLSIDNVHTLRKINPDMRIFNEYGPTEATVGCVVKEMEADPKIISIGVPIDNMQAYVLDAFLNPVPKGVKGELYLGGKGLAKGYYKNNRLTKERFIINPFIPGGKMYKTGDLAFWNKDNELVFVGRNDFQVKVRGYRIEPGEIENALLAIPEVSEAIVISKPQASGDRILLAYYTSREQDLDEYIRAELKKSLPAYMVPQLMMRLEKMPLGSNGKIDRKALPEQIVQVKSHMEAQTPTEIKLAALWKEALGLSKASITENFFSLGGHSLKAAILCSEIERALDKKINLKSFFLYPTIQEQAAFLDQQEDSVFRAIAKLEKKEAYELSPAQRRLWVLDQIHGGSIEYNMPGMYHFEKEIDPVLLQKAFDLLIAKHEILRTNFISTEGEPKQIVHDKLDFQVALADLSGKTNFEKELKFIFNTESEYPFDLTRDKLLRATLVKENKESWHLVFVMHHIISDGWSMDILQRELNQTYAELASKGSATVTELEIQYRDYAAWQNQLVVSEDFSEHKMYWLDLLAGTLPVTEIPKDYNLRSEAQNTGSRYTFYLEKEQYEELIKMTAAYNTSLFMILLSVFNVLLHKLSQSDNIIVGTPVAGRQRAEIKNLIGFFLNTVILRNSIEEYASFRDFILKIKNNTLEALDHQDYPFEQLVDDLNITRDINRFPVTSIFFNMLNTGEKGGELNSFTPSYDHHNHRLKFDIDFYASEYKNGLRFDIDYKNELYNPASIALVAEKFKQLISQLITDPEIRIKELKTQTIPKIAAPAKRAKWFSPDKNILSVFAEAVVANPRRTAVRYSDTLLSYGELDNLSASIANAIYRQTQTRGKVGVYVSHNHLLAPSVFGVLKSGNVYVSLDPAYPEERTEFIISENELKLILVDSKTISAMKRIAPDAQLINVEEVQPSEKLNFSISIQPADNAYILYTSGSTGKPKGVVQTHAAVLHFISAYATELKISEQDVLTGFSSVSFDSFNNDFFGALLNGACYCPVSLKTDLSLNQLHDWLIKNHITFFHAVPTVFRAFASALLENGQNLNQLRIVKMTGEATKYSDFELFKKVSSARTEFVITYGCTESTLNNLAIYTHETQVSRNVLAPGHAVANTEIKIINNAGRVLDCLEVGEIAVGSTFITTGYYNNEELNKKAFLQINGKRFYRTGDEGRILADGTLEIIGRKDGQVKIRGVRVELGEIEHAVVSFKGISQAVVSVHADGTGMEQITAYYTAEGNIDKAELRKYLSRKLPDYFIPVYYFLLDEFPLTPNGKIDKKNLPVPTNDAIAISTGYEAPSTDMEKQLAEIWQQVLDREKVGIKDNFFELGGHSLKATAFVARLYKQANIQVPLQEVFKNPTIAGLAHYIENKGKSIYAGIEKVGEREFYPLTSAQKRLYVLNQFNKDSTNYNMPAANHIYGTLDLDKLNNVFKKLVERYDSLRTQFVERNNEVVQVVHPSIDFKIAFQERKVDEIDAVIREFIRPFNLAEAPLLRIGLVKFAADHHLLMFDMHHIISDGRSLQVIIDDFVRLYARQELPPLRIQYKDYAVWQKEFYTKPEILQQEEYWLKELADPAPLLELPYDYPRPDFISNNGSRYRFSLTREQSAKIKFLGRKKAATSFMTLLAAYNVLLHKFSGNKDLVVGSPIAGRPDVDLENIIGMFVNVLAIRTQPQGDLSFTQYLNQVKQKAVNAYDNQFFSFESIVEKLDLLRDTSRNPVFDTMFVFQDPPDIAASMNAELEFVYHKQENTTSKFDISFIAINGDNIDVEIEYCTDLFKVATIEELAQGYLKIIDQVLENEEILIKDIQVLSDKKQHELTKLRVTKIDHNISKTVSQLITENCRKYPDDPAIGYNGKSISYGEMKTMVDAYTFLLKGIRNERVGILMEKSPEMIYAILGILKSGNSYVPLDTNLPEKRIDFIINDAHIKHIISSKDIELSFAAERINTEDVQAAAEEITDLSSLEDEVYVIYTSGSSGKPKGVSIGNYSLKDKLATKVKVYEFNKTLTTIFTSSQTFDASVLEIFLPLVTGGKLVIPVADRQFDFEYLFNIMKQEKVSVLQGTNSYFKTFIQNIEKEDKSGHHLKNLCIGGESLTKDLVRDLRMEFPGVAINNHYGPTEATVDAIIKRNIKTFDKDVIGKPLPNIPIYILCEHGKLVPDGVKGEIYIGGKTLAKGYVNNPELTGRSFVEDPFNPGEKIYKTGDLGRWLRSGEIEFFGRKDQQVKIRGYRVELGEIQTLLIENDFIKNAVVIARENKQGDNEIIAYFSSDKEVNIVELRTVLGQNLPAYMIPSHFVKIDQIPMTKSGKLDVKALPAPSDFSLDSGIEYVEARDDFEKELTAIWKEILEKENVSIRENFFELGGHSLKATQVVSRIQRGLKRNVNLRDFFKNPTIEKLSDFLKKSDKASFTGIEPVPLAEHYPLSNPQKRLWVIDQLNGMSAVYNMSNAYVFEGALDVASFERSFEMLVQRHEALRTIFISIEGEPRQKIVGDIGFKIEFEDLSTGADPIEAAKKKARENSALPFDLSKGPLIRCLLLKVEENKHVFVLTMHHIISDGWSLEVLVNEMSIVYKALIKNNPVSLKPLKIQYKDFAHYQNNKIAAEDEAYWLQKLAGDISLIKLSYDFPKSDLNESKGEQERILVEAEIVDALRDLARQHQTTLSNVVFAVFNILMSQLSGQKDILIGMTTANRNHPDIEDLIGFFVNSLVIRTDLTGDVAFGDLIEQVKQNTTEAFEHQDYPFDMLVEKISPQRFANQQPLVNVTYSFQNLNDIKFNNKDTDAAWEKEKELQISFLNFGEGNNTSKYDLLLFVNEVDGGLDLKFEYDSSLFKRTTITKYLQYFKKFLLMVTQTEKA